MKIADGEWELTAYRLKPLEIESNEDIRIYVYPLGKGLIPFAFVLDIKKLKTSCEQVEVVEIYGDCLMELVPLVVPKGNATPTKTKKIMLAGVQHNIEYSTFSPLYCQIENGEKYVKIVSDKTTYTFEYITSKNKIMIYAKSDDGYVVSLINLTTYKVEFTKDVMMLEKDDKEITTLTNLYDCHHHGLVEKYNIGDDFQKKYEIVYIDGNGFETTDKKFVPYAFMDALHCEDFVLAKKFLTPALSSKLDKEHLKAFFGEFEKIDSGITEEKDNCIMAIYNENGKKYAKVFYFDINENGRIENISEK